MGRFNSFGAMFCSCVISALQNLRARHPTFQ
jgi:hypothetical protein